MVTIPETIREFPLVCVINTFPLPEAPVYPVETVVLLTSDVPEKVILPDP